MKRLQRFRKTLFILLPLLLPPLSMAANQATTDNKASRGFTLLYSSNVMGEYEPCG